MKKSLVALATLSVVGTAFADVDVSGGIKLYGVLDQAVQSQTLIDPQQASTVASTTSTGLFAAAATSRLGVRGNRDLEGGTRATIQAEIQLAPDTPKALLPAANRGTFVGLENKSAGIIRLGTQETIAYETFAMDPNGRVEYKPQLWRLTTAPSVTNSDQDRAGNAIKYVSPEVVGTTLHLMQGFSQKITAGQEYSSIGLKTTQGSLKASFVWDRVLNAIGNVCLPGTNCTDGVYKDGNSASTNYAQFGGSTTSALYRDIGAVVWDKGEFSLHYIYAKAYTIKNSGNITTSTFGIRIPVDKFTLAASYGYGSLSSGITASGAAVGAKDATLTDTTLGAYYNFDKSTQAYFLGSKTTTSSGYYRSGSVATTSIGARYNF